MIIPTPEYNPLFADDGLPFQEKMCDYIRMEFADILGTKMGLLKSVGGLERLAELSAQTSVDLRPNKVA